MSFYLAITIWSVLGMAILVMFGLRRRQFLFVLPAFMWFVMSAGFYGALLVMPIDAVTRETASRVLRWYGSFALIAYALLACR